MTFTRNILAVSAAVAALLAGEPRAHAFQKAAVDKADLQAESVEFDVYLPLQNEAELDRLIELQQTKASPLYHRWLTPEQFQARYGADSVTLAQIRQELEAVGLRVTAVHAHGLHVAGAAEAVEHAFSIKLAAAHFANGTRTFVAGRAPTLTPSMRRAGAVVADFSGVERMHRDAIRLGKVSKASRDNRASPVGDYWFDDLKQAYDYPSYLALTGKGANIGILMTGDFNPPDMKAYFSHEKLATPKISTVEVYGGAPYDPNGSFETHLDIQQSGGMAPGANIVLYNIPDLTDASILAGLTTIIEGNASDVVNMSFGGFENQYAAAYPFNNGTAQFGILAVYDDLFKQGNVQGITFVASSGDTGALEGIPPACFEPNATSKCGSAYLNVNSPASSPHVTGVGGTNLVTTYDKSNPKDLNSAYVSENAFYDKLTADIFYLTPATGNVWGSGGGISQYYPKPSYQNLVDTGSWKYRTVPDVSVHMGGCPIGAVLPCGADRSADIAAIDGSFYGVIGTSASAPDFTGLVALAVERFGQRVGNVNYELYSLSAQQADGILPVNPFHQGIPGNNGYYKTHPGYNLVLGNGTIAGKYVILDGSAGSAKVPQTPSNP